jgi:hypothetical protein
MLSGVWRILHSLYGAQPPTANGAA